MESLSSPIRAQTRSYAPSGCGHGQYLSWLDQTAIQVVDGDDGVDLAANVIGAISTFRNRPEVVSAVHSDLLHAGRGASIDISG